MLKLENLMWHAETSYIDGCDGDMTSHLGNLETKFYIEHHYNQVCGKSMILIILEFLKHHQSKVVKGQQQ